MTQREIDFTAFETWFQENGDRIIIRSPVFRRAGRVTDDRDEAITRLLSEFAKDVHLALYLVSRRAGIELPENVLSSAQRLRVATLIGEPYASEETARIAAKYNEG